MAAIAVVPPAEDEKAEKLAMEREKLLHGGSQVQPAKQDAKPDWKSSDLDEGIRHAEYLCRELHEEQIMQLLSMEKFKAAASCKGETGTIEVKKLSGDARVEFFTMVEDMVIKKVSIPGPVMARKPAAASEPVEAGPPSLPRFHRLKRQML